VSQNTHRQLMILGTCALCFVLFSIYRRGVENGWSVMQRVYGTGKLVTDIGSDEETEPETAKAVGQAEERQAAGVQVTAYEENPDVRVQLCTDDYAGKYHEKLTLVCSTAYTVSYGDVTEEHKASEPVWFTLDDPWLEHGTVTLVPKKKKGVFTFSDLKRAQGAPSYTGKILVERKEEGLLVMNELPLETYLCSVVPSEMPSGYPMEALKAQAVCARTYALKQLQTGRRTEGGADLDDSVSYQVYNNFKRDERTDLAVKETKGKVLTQDGELVDALYYSTSCGIDLSRNLSEEAVFCAFMSGNDEAYEKEEPWYRWSTYFSLEELTRLAGTESQEAGEVSGMRVSERENSGVIKTLEIIGSGGSFEVEGEYEIRKLLQTQNAPVTLQDGSTAPNLGMLPSAFFYLTEEKEGGVLKGYTLKGGGYGHGKGMSQNGAKHMAEAGRSCVDILRYYYG